MILHHDQVGFIPVMQGFLNICKSINVIYYANKLKDKNQNNFNRCRKRFWQNSAPIYDKDSSENGHRRSLPQHNKSHIWQTHRKHYSQWWKTEIISSKIRNKTRVPLTTLLFNIVLEVLAMAIREEKEIKESRLEKKK